MHSGTCLRSSTGPQSELESGLGSLLHLQCREEKGKEEAEGGTEGKERKGKGESGERGRCPPVCAY